MTKPATILDVAKRAQLSMKTVSRVLNDEPHVDPRTRERVLAAAKALNYRPNRFARSLAGNRSYLIGLVYAKPSPAYVMAIQEGVLERCEEKGYNLVLRPYDVDEDGVAERVREFIEQSRVDGVVLIPPLSDHRPLVESLVAAGVRHVRVSQWQFAGSVHVNTDEARVARDLTHYLIGLGHTRIGFIKGHPDHAGSADRLEGFLTALAEAGIERRREYLAQGLFTFESGAACARELLDLEAPPTAIFASNDYMAAGVVSAAHGAGIRVPQDLSVVGFDDAPVSRQIWPALTTVRQPVRKLAGMATSLLIRQIAGRTEEEGLRALECHIVVRDSTGPAPAPLTQSKSAGR